MFINHDLVLIKICRFMINPKQARKNKARIEGSICTSYIYRETTHFCSDYFNNFMKLKLKGVHQFSHFC